MKARNVMLVGLVVVLALGALVIAGCGGDSEEAAKAELTAALAPIQTAVTDLTSKGASLTIPDIKAARDSLKGNWQKAVDAAGKLGADTGAAETAFTELDAAITALPDDANIVQAGQALMAKLPPLLAALSEFQKLVGESE